MTDASFHKYAHYYDLLYLDKNYQAEVDYVAALLSKYAHSNKRVLEFGSGTGIHGSLLANEQRPVDGIELSAEMASRSRLSEHFSVTVGDIAFTKMNRTYGAVLALFHVVSYLTTREKQLEVLENANRHLDVGGYFIFDVWYSPAVLANVPEVRVKKMRDETMEVIRLAEPIVDFQAKNVEVNYSIFIRDRESEKFELVRESHLLHHFDLEEIRELAHKTGFEIVKNEEFLTSRIASRDTWGVCFILRKI